MIVIRFEFVRFFFQRFQIADAEMTNTWKLL